MKPFFKLKIYTLLVFAFILGPSLGAQNCEDYAERFPTLQSQPQPHERSLASLTAFGILAFNVMNFYVTAGKVSRDPETGAMLRDPKGSLAYLKAPDQPRREGELNETVEPMQELRPDLMGLEEIEGGPTTLAHLVERKLADAYNPFLISGNDPRGINVGALIPKDLPFQIEFVSYRNVPLAPGLYSDSQKLFSRDAPLLTLRARGADPKGPPYLIYQMMHAKSKRPSPRDPESTKLRTAQMDAVSQIYKALLQKYGQNLRYAVGGDFNTSITAPEIKPLLDAGLVEGFHLLATLPPEIDRYTHAYFPRDPHSHQDLAPEYHQIDGIFLSPALQKAFQSVIVYRYHDEQGHLLPIPPKNMNERKKQPSDHNPYFLTLNAKQLFASYLVDLRAAGLDSEEFIAGLSGLRGH